MSSSSEPGGAHALADDAPAARTGPMAAVGRAWILTLVLVIVGGAIGGALATARTTKYTAESRLIVGSNDLSSYEVAGFAEASQELAANYARYVDNSSTVSSTLDQQLGVRTADLVSISASPIADSDVLSVEVVATTRQAAIAGARSIADTLVKLTGGDGQTSAQRLLQTYEKLAASAQAARDMATALATTVKNTPRPSATLQASLAAAQTQSASLTLQASAAAANYQNVVVNPPSQSQLSVIESASILSNDKKKTLEIFVVGGVILGLVLAFLIANVLELRRERRRTSDDRGSSNNHPEIIAGRVDRRRVGRIGTAPRVRRR